MSEKTKNDRKSLAAANRAPNAIGKVVTALTIAAVGGIFADKILTSNSAPKAPASVIHAWNPKDKSQAYEITFGSSRINPKIYGENLPTITNFAGAVRRGEGLSPNGPGKANIISETEIATNTDGMNDDGEVQTDPTEPYIVQFSPKVDPGVVAEAAKEFDIDLQAVAPKR